MPEFLEIRSLSEAEVDRLEADIHAAIADKKARGLLTDRDVADIMEMRLRPLPDIQDVQSVYENTLFTKK
jgi:hypothetical protein